MSSDDAEPSDTTVAEPSDDSDDADGLDDADADDDADAAGDAGGDADDQDAQDGAAPDDEPAPEIGPAADLGEFNDYDPTDYDATLLRVDPNVLIGQLDNGLRYYLRENDSPGSAVVMHLVVNAGALLDPPGAEGAAHFLEHMLFNGTERFSKNDLDQVLRDIGTDFGADLNAYTSADETVYILDFQLDNPEAIELAFTVLSQWASAATILPSDVEDERGIVVDEHRLRDESASGRISQVLEDIYNKGTVYEGIAVGGTLESNATVTPEQLRDYYDTWYRPDNMAVVMVGDVNTEAMEKLVVEYFDELTPRTETAPDQPERHAFTATFWSEAVADVATHPDHGDSYISLDWQLPAWPGGTVGGERLRMMENVIAGMLDIRLDAAYQAGLLAQTTEPHFGAFPSARALRFYGTNFQGPDLGRATTDYISAIEGAAHYGFSQAELDQVIASINTSLDFQLDSEDTRQDSEYSFSYVNYFLSGADISATSEQVGRRRALVGSFTVEELTAHLRWVLDMAPPIAVSIGPDPSVVPTAKELLEAIAAVYPLAPPEAEDSIDALMSRPDSVEPASHGALDVFEDAYEWKFANGASVVFVPSDIAAGEVNVLAEGLGGWSTLTPGDSAIARHAVGAVVASGVGDASATQLDEFLANTTARVSPFIAEFSEGFSGAAASDDLETLFTLMHLFITEPRINDVAVGAQVQAMESRRANSTTFPQWISELALLDALYVGSDWHQFIATQAQIDATTSQSLSDLYLARLGDVDDLMVVVVGDIDRAAVADLAARYVGTLPAGALDSFENRRPEFPQGVQRITIPVDADAGASGFDIMFGATTPITIDALVTASVVKEVFDDLFVGGVREELGDAYSVAVSVSADEATGTWTARVSSTGGSEDLVEGHAQVIDIIEGVVANGPTDRDLQQAISVVRDNLVLESNALILNPLLRRQHLADDDIGTPAQRRAALTRVNADDVQRYAALFFDLANRIEVFRTAE